MTPLRSSSSATSAWPVMTVVAALIPHLPCSVALNPFAFSVLALDLVRPDRLANSARLTSSGRSLPPASRRMSSSVLSIISCRSLRSLILLSIVLLTLAYRQIPV